MNKSLELEVDKYYHFKELKNNYHLKLIQFLPQHSIFINKYGEQYTFKHQPFKQLRIRYVFQQSLNNEDNELYTQFEAQENTDELFNCYSSHRLLL